MCSSKLEGSQEAHIEDSHFRAAEGEFVKQVFQMNLKQNAAPSVRYVLNAEHGLNV